MATYERLRDKGIRPVFPINHGPTTSMYYADPDGNQIELQVDNYDKIEDATAFFYSEAFAENPVGVEFAIGRASCRERVCQYVSISVVAVSLKKTTLNNSM